MATVRIGCASAFWGDTNAAARQLVAVAGLDYLVFDYLAEITMSILAAKRRKHDNAGYAEDFVTHALAPILGQIKTRGIRVVSNAGGINPQACRQALAAAASEAGLEFSIAVVEGDDLTGSLDAIGDRLAPFEGNPRELPGRLASMNAYLGAGPIAAALYAGADIVITGRCVDSAVVLGPLIHEHGWSSDDYDRLAQGALTGHIVECGAQCTGGNFTDWQRVAEGYADMGFPVVEVEADGAFTVTKPAGTGGRVCRETIAEQLLYEIGDPRAYRLPDVTCDFTAVTLDEIGDDRVRVTGARGRMPPDVYKVSATCLDGYRANALFVVGGIDALAKAECVGAAIVERTRALFAERGLGNYTATHLEALGAESMYGPHAAPGARATREVVVKLAVRHASREALGLFAREIAQAATAMVPGITGYFGGRPNVGPVIRLVSYLLDKDAITPVVDIDGARHELAAAPGAPIDNAVLPVPAEGERWTPDADALEVPLIALALARSGDKGDDANIGVLARERDYLPYIRAALTDAAVAARFDHLLDGSVRHWELHGIGALNFVLTHALGGGGIASLRADTQGKCYGQILLDMPVAVPAALAARLGYPDGVSTCN